MEGDLYLDSFLEAVLFGAGRGEGGAMVFENH